MAHLVRSALEELGLRSYPKTSGADGIHVLVPITRRSSYRDAYDLAELVSRGLEAENPGLVTTEWLKKKRRGVLVDHRQNGHGKTIASAYSVRPKPGAPVSTLLRWEELGEKVRPRDFGRREALQRVDQPIAEAVFDRLQTAKAVDAKGGGLHEDAPAGSAMTSRRSSRARSPASTASRASGSLDPARRATKRPRTERSPASRSRS